MRTAFIKPGTNKGVGGPPKICLQEFADEVGATVRYLCGKLARDPTSPKPSLKNVSRFGNKSYYAAAEIRAWWATAKNSK